MVERRIVDLLRPLLVTVPAAAPIAPWGLGKLYTFFLHQNYFKIKEENNRDLGTQGL